MSRSLAHPHPPPSYPTSRATSVRMTDGCDRTPNPPPPPFAPPPPKKPPPLTNKKNRRSRILEGGDGNRHNYRDGGICRGWEGAGEGARCHPSGGGGSGGLGLHSQAIER